MERGELTMIDVQEIAGVGQEKSKQKKEQKIIAYLEVLKMMEVVEWLQKPKRSPWGDACEIATTVSVSWSEAMAEVPEEEAKLPSAARASFTALTTVARKARPI